MLVICNHTRFAVNPSEYLLCFPLFLFTICINWNAVKDHWVLLYSTNLFHSIVSE